jgi:hypothetical protein
MPNESVYWTLGERFPSASTVEGDLGEWHVARRFPGLLTVSLRGQRVPLMDEIDVEAGSSGRSISLIEADSSRWTIEHVVQLTIPPTKDDGPN